MLSKLATAALVGFAGAQDLRLFAPVQPAVQPALQPAVALQPTSQLAYPQSVVVVDAATEAAGETQSQWGFNVLAGLSLGLVSAGVARAVTKSSAPNAPEAAIDEELLAAPTGSALPGPTVAMAAVSAKTSITLGDIGTTKPLGVYDPLQLMTKYPERYRRFQELEIKHGRFAMAACLHVFLTEAGVRWPGYLSIAEDIKFSDMPGGTIASWAALPNLAWAQIVLIVALLDNSVLKQDPEKEPGDVIGDLPWVRYEDKPGQSGKEFKLNVERNNGRAAMMGITGMIIHEGLTGNPLFPIEVPAQPILNDLLDDVEKGPARVGSFVLVSLGMAFCGIIAAIPEFQKADQAAAAAISSRGYQKR
jgi:light-harvesting complex I chlorophyll a/b binding protein 1